MREDEICSFEDIAGSLESNTLTKIQANLGKLCNLSCSHCHLAASPQATEVMPWKVMQEILEVINKTGVADIDITGGAPELNLNLINFIDRLHRPGLNIQLRTNLVALINPEQNGLAEFLYNRKVKLIASLPCYLEENVRAQRGDNVFDRSIEALKQLNHLGYGIEANNSLDLVYNPGGPFLPGRQEDLEAIYREELNLQHGISFNRLLVLTNMPLGRFKNKLNLNGQLTEYMDLLKSAYNEDNLSALMCRNQISVGWNGRLYDCDFNLALDYPVKVSGYHIADFDRQKLQRRTIATGDHCFGCTAGAGSSCGGALIVGGS